MTKFIFIVLGFVWTLLDRFVPKSNKCWGFSTHHILDSQLIENQRAIFESVKLRADIKKFVFYRNIFEGDISDAQNAHLVKIGSLKYFLYILRCGIIFVGHSISMDYSIRWVNNFYVLRINMNSRRVINLWHGIPIKRLLQLANEKTRWHTDRVAYRRYERSHYAGLISSSDVDSYAMATMFYPIEYNKIWVTGLPRYDFLSMKYDSLPVYLKTSIDKIRNIVANKRLVIYAPTYRQTDVVSDAYYYQFSDSEIRDLKRILIKNNAVLGYRPHYFKNNLNYFNLDKYLDGEHLIDFSQDVIPDFSALVRECDLLISDYSSVFLDALYLSKNRLCFAYDWDNYLIQQDGLLYDSSLIFDRKPNKTFDELLKALDSTLSNNEIDSQFDEVMKKMFFKYMDDSNSIRVVNYIDNLHR